MLDALNPLILGTLDSSVVAPLASLSDTLSSPLVWSYLLHVVAAGGWTGSVLYVVLAVLPVARRGNLTQDGFVTTVDGLLQLTRLTGVVLPVTGLYQIHRLYSLDRLLGTPTGWVVVSMAVLWTLTNGLVEMGVLRVRSATGDVSLATYFVERFTLDGQSRSVPTLAALARPYFLAAALGSVLLLVTAAVLASGVV
jgi:hypothetical protein